MRSVSSVSLVRAKITVLLGPLIASRNPAESLGSGQSVLSTTRSPLTSGRSPASVVSNAPARSFRVSPDNLELQVAHDLAVGGVEDRQLTGPNDIVRAEKLSEDDAVAPHLVVVAILVRPNVIEDGRSQRTDERLLIGEARDAELARFVLTITGWSWTPSTKMTTMTLPSLFVELVAAEAEPGSLLCGSARRPRPYRAT